MLKFLMADTANDAFTSWSDRVWEAVNRILVPILVVACAVGIIYAIVIGIQMMKADSKDKREENKARLINIAISIVAIAVLIGLFYALKAWLTGNGTNKDLNNEFGGLFGEGTGNVSPLMNTVSLVKQCISLWL